MQFHRGRLIDHLHLHVRDLEASKAFYKAVLAAIGNGVAVQDMPGAFTFDELWIDAEPGHAAAPIHFAFQADDRAAVDRFYAAALRAGGRDNGAPGERDYHPGYYAAFVLDPDGNNIEAVHHGPVKRSAASVVLEA